MSTQLLVFSSVFRIRIRMVPESNMDLIRMAIRKEEEKLNFESWILPSENWRLLLERWRAFLTRKIPKLDNFYLFLPLEKHGSGSAFPTIYFSPWKKHGKDMDPDPHSSKSLDLDTLKKEGCGMRIQKHCLVHISAIIRKFLPVLRIWSRIHWIGMLLGLPDPLLRDPDPSIIKQK